MYKISFKPECLELTREPGDEACFLRVPHEVLLGDTKYRIRDYGFYKAGDGYYYIPKASYNSCWERFSRRLDLFHKIVMLFEAYSIPYTLDISPKLNITNQKGKVYAYLL